MKKSIKPFIIGLAIGLVALPVTVSAAQTVFDETVKVHPGDSGQSISRFDDDKFQVKCWVSDGYKSGGISCLPWSQVKER